MSKRKGRKALSRPATNHTASQQQPVEAFTLANPPPCSTSGKYWITSNAPATVKWYDPPISFDGLARSFRAAVHHSSPLYVKRNILASTFIPHSMLSQAII